MNARSATKQKPAESSPAGKPESSTKPQNFVAYYVNPACEHKWSKLATDLQTLESEGKIIWKCSTCAEVSTTYDWQLPEE
jgi:hypothetical protein